MSTRPLAPWCRRSPRLLMSPRPFPGLIALAFGLLVGAHQITLWMIYVLALCLGFVNVFDNPARQALISELVPPEQLRIGVTLNSVTANMARVLGAAGGGGITAVLGLAMCFNLNAASFGAVLISLVAMGPGATRAPVRPPPWKGELRAGFRHVRSRPELFIPLIMVAVVGTLAWEFQVSLPLLATVTFHGGAGTYGLMTAFMGAGAIVGGLVSASRSTSSWNSLPSPRSAGESLLPSRPWRQGSRLNTRPCCSWVTAASPLILREDHPATGRFARDARPRHGAMGAGLARIDACRRPYCRLGGAIRRPSLGIADRRAAHHRDRPAGISAPRTCPPRRIVTRRHELLTTSS